MRCWSLGLYGNQDQRLSGGGGKNKGYGIAEGAMRLSERIKAVEVARQKGARWAGVSMQRDESIRFFERQETAEAWMMKRPGREYVDIEEYWRRLGEYGKVLA